MAEKKAKTAQKNPGAVMVKHACPSCGSDSRVTYFTGFGPQKGFFWVWPPVVISRIVSQTS